MPQQTQTRKIIVKVDTSDAQGLREIADKMGLLNKSTKSAATSLGFLSDAFKTYLGFLGVREIGRLSDGMQNLSNRLKIVTQSGESSTEVLGKIADLADRTNQSIEAVGTSYVRFGSSLKAVKATSSELTALTEVLINTFKISGSGASETSNAMVQLSQAFSTGVLRGQDLRSVLEQNSELAGILRQRFGQNIFKQAEKGAITITEVLKLLVANQNRVNESAQRLTPTFEQSVTKAMNKVSLAINDLNQKYDVSGKFATILAFVVNNLGTIFESAAIVILAFAATTIPALITSLVALKNAFIAFAASNPIVLLVTLISIGLVALVNNFDAVQIAVAKTKAVFLDFAADMEEKFGGAVNKVDALFSKTFAENRLKETTKRVADLRKVAEETRKAVAAAEAKKKISDDPGKALKDLLDKYKLLGQGLKEQKIKEILGEINTEFVKGKISAAQYNEKLVSFELYKLNRQFKEGKFDLFAYNEGLAKLNIQDLNRELDQGVITLGQYRDQVRSIELKNLDDKLKAGKVTLIEYNQELIKLSEQFQPGGALIVGTNAYIESVGTLSENVAKGITGVFNELETGLTNFIRKGKFDFDQFTNAILDDIAKIIVRAAIIRPLAEGILGYSNPLRQGPATPSAGTSGDFSGTAAHGMAFDNGIQKFASGGIVNSPTTFGFNRGKTGLMGEAGTEAILPLRRGRGGDLGVAAQVTPVNININNMNGSQISQQETTGPNGEKTIDILIHSKVNDAIARGSFDKSMKFAYGLNRKGS